MKTITKFYTLLIFFSLLTGSSYAQWTALTNSPANANRGGMLLLSDGTVIAKSIGGGGEGNLEGLEVLPK